MEEGYLLACSPMAYSVTFLTEPRTACLAWLHPLWLDPLTATINQENTSRDLPMGQCKGDDIFSVEGPFFQISLSCVKMTKTKQNKQTNKKKLVSAEPEGMGPTGEAPLNPS